MDILSAGERDIQEPRGETLHIDGVRLTLGQFTLDIEALRLTEGLTLLAGPNGAGKTTLLRTIAGTIRRQRGAISLYGAPVAPSQVSLLPQRPSLPLDLNAAEVAEYIAWLHGANGSRAHEQAHELLHAFDLAGVEDKPVRTLSGGMARRLAIACSVLAAPDVLLLDEPTNDLDPIQKASVLDMITELAQDRVVVVSSHALHDLAERADQIVILNRGHVVADGNLSTLRASHGAGDAGLEAIYRHAIMADDAGA